MGSGASTEQGQAAPAIIDGEAAILEGPAACCCHATTSTKAQVQFASSGRPVAVVAPVEVASRRSWRIVGLREEYDIVGAVSSGPRVGPRTS